MPTLVESGALSLTSNRVEQIVSKRRAWRVKQQKVSLGWKIGLAVLLSVVFSNRAPATNELKFVTPEFAPFAYLDGSQVAGPARDIIAAACERSELSCSFELFPSRRARDMLRSGAADGMMILGRNSEREEWLRFSPPMIQTEYGFFVAEDNPIEFIDLEGIAGYRIGVFAPSNTEKQLKGIQNEMSELGLTPFEIEDHPDDAAGFRKLAAGRLDAVYSNRDRGLEIIADEGLEGQIRYAGKDRSITYYAGINKGFLRQELVDILFESWNQLYANGEAVDILQSYGLEPPKE